MGCNSYNRYCDYCSWDGAIRTSPERHKQEYNTLATKENDSDKASEIREEIKKFKKKYKKLQI
jgi:hypothetical protein